MQPMAFRLATAAGGLAILLAGTSARADAIDGDWCNATHNLNIRGPDLRTPGGNQIKGDYDRHGFRYVVPAGEPGAGEQIVMRLQGEENMLLQRGSAQATPEQWRRCKPIS